MNGTHGGLRNEQCLLQLLQSLLRLYVIESFTNAKGASLKAALLYD